MLFQLRIDSDTAQDLSDIREAMGHTQQTLHMEQSGRPKGGNVILRDEASHAQGGSSIGTLIAGIAPMAKNVMDRDMKIASRPQHELVALVGQCNLLFSVSNTKCNTSRVFGIIKIRALSPRGTKNNISKFFKITEFRGVVVARCGS